MACMFCRGVYNVNHDVALLLTPWRGLKTKVTNKILYIMNIKTFDKYHGMILRRGRDFNPTNTVPRRLPWNAKARSHASHGSALSVDRFGYAWGGWLCVQCHIMVKRRGVEDKGRAHRYSRPPDIG